MFEGQCEILVNFCLKYIPLLVIEMSFFISELHRRRNCVALGWTFVSGLAKMTCVESSHSETTGIVKLVLLSPVLVNGSTYSKINCLVL